LTDPEIVRILLSDHDMKGTGIIRAKEIHCPTCGDKYSELRGVGFICQKCKTTPRKFFLDLFWQGKRFRVYSDKNGQVLDSYDRARVLLRTIQGEIDFHTFDPRKYLKDEQAKYHVDTLLGRYEGYKLKGLAPGYRHYFSHMVDIAKEYFGGQDVRDLRKIDLIGYKEHLESVYSWKPKTTKNVMDIVKSFLFWCKDDVELIDTVPPFPVVEVPEAAFRWLAQKDQVSIFQHVRDEHKPFIGFLFLHGTRPGEARALKCKNIDLEHQSITISATFSGGEYCERRKGRGARILTIPIHPELLDWLKQRVESSLPEAFVFVNPNTGNPFTEHKVLEIWNGIRKRAGLSKELRLYDASRHSFASQLVNEGVSIFKVSKLLGHSSTKMTEKYSHANVNSMRADLAKLTLKPKDNIFGLSPRKKKSED
jgi:integrase